MTEQAAIEQIKNWVVNDYFTPNIKAEVILDALLTRYVAEIIEEQFQDGPCFQGTLRFVTKEMSVRDLKKPLENVSYGNKGTKIDYILGDGQAFYLVELKTTDSSIKSRQDERYLSNCSGSDKTFGTVFGEKLLTIVNEAFAGTYKKRFLEQFGAESSAWNDETLQGAFRLVFDTYQKFDVAAPPFDQAEMAEEMAQNTGSRKTKSFAQAAKALIKKAGWTQSDSTRSRKYLYTMGQLLDYRTTIGRPQELRKDTLWSRPLKLIYLTPSGSLPYEKYMDYPKFYLHPKGKGGVSLTEEGTGSVSLIKARKYLAEKTDDDFARLLADVITEIFPED